jgi:hypothetical protein
MAFSSKSTSKNLYIRKFVYLVDSLLYIIWFHIWFQLLNYSFSLIFLTTYEKEKLNKQIQHNILKFIISITLAVLLTPIGLLFLLLWVIIIRIMFRNKPYRLSVKSNLDKDQIIFDSNKKYQLISTNVCLLPEFLARFNNLKETDKRLIEISKILTDSTLNDHDNQNEANDASFVEIVDDFSKHAENIDFICFQEIWTVRHCKKLKDLIHHKYPYIVYDCGINTIQSNCLIGLDSGLMVCSKYPILNIEFKTFGQKMKACRFSSKGLLIVKVKKHDK